MSLLSHIVWRQCPEGELAGRIGSKPFTIFAHPPNGASRSRQSGDDPVLQPLAKFLRRQSRGGQFGNLSYDVADMLLSPLDRLRIECLLSVHEEMAMPSTLARSASERISKVPSLG